MEQKQIIEHLYPEDQTIQALKDGMKILNKKLHDIQQLIQTLQEKENLAHTYLKDELEKCQQNIENYKQQNNQSSVIAPQEPMQSPTIGKLAAALSKAQRAFLEIGKNRKGQFQYADRHHMKRAYEDALAQYGLAVSCTLKIKTDSSEVFRCILMHESNEWLISECSFEPHINGKRTAIQERGSDMTYLARYMCSLILNFTIANDPDDRDGEEIKDQAKENR